MTAAPDLLVVASTRRWVADDLAAGCPVPVVHDLGLDAPELPGHLRPAWWTPTEHAAALLRAGIPFTAASPGPTWLSGVGVELTGRPVWSGPLAAIDEAPRAGWCKPAEAKVAALPAAWWDDTTVFAAAATAAGLPGESLVQVSPTRLRLGEEHRFVVLDGQVVTGSWYLTPAGTWDPDASPPVDAPSAAAFAADAVRELGPAQPGSYILDVGFCTDAGRWLLIEANPVWSSAMYGCRPGPFADAVLAAFTAPGPWAWSPDPWLRQRAARRAPLRPCRPLWLSDDGTVRDLRPGR